jgi:hypothetical protein
MSLWIRFASFFALAVGTPVTAGEVTCEAIVYGQKVFATLPCLGAGFKVLDWDGAGVFHLTKLYRKGHIDL